MHTPTRITFVCLSLLLSACATTQPTSPTSDTANEPASDPSIANLVFEPSEVRTEGWSSYTSEELGISFKYPLTYTVLEEGEKIVIKRTDETSSENITIVKVESTLVTEVAKRFYQASRIEKNFGSPSPDRSVETTIAHYQSGDAYSWFMTYLMTRTSDMPSFPDFEEQSAAYDIIIAEVEAYPPEDAVRAAMQIDRADDLLSEPQQILSTIRFTK